jgi:hypothetical protein
MCDIHEEEEIICTTSLQSHRIYCEFCEKALAPINKLQVLIGIHDQYLYEHEDVYHGEMEDLHEYVHKLH